MSSGDVKRCRLSCGTHFVNSHSVVASEMFRTGNKSMRNERVRSVEK